MANAGDPAVPLRPVAQATTTVLFGAGVSRDAGGPDARQLIEAIAGALLDDPRTAEWIVEEMWARRLRFETAVEELENVTDPGLRLLGLFDALGPGPVHRAPSSAAVRGTLLATVNFDHLQEQALRDVGVQAWTVDLQNEDIPASPDGVPVVKLHGTTRLGRGAAGEQVAETPLHATIAAIVEAGGGAGLSPPVEDRVRRLIDGRTLVVVGYSGSEDLDVIPTLTRCRPSHVVWVDQTSEDPVAAERRSAWPDAVAALLARGNDPERRSRSSAAAPERCCPNWGSPSPKPAPSDTTSAAEWRSWLEEWAVEARRRDPTGFAWAAGIAGTLGRFDLESDVLRRSVAADSGVGWTPQRRLQIAQNGYLRDTMTPKEVIDAARRAADAAVDARDVRTEAQAHLLVARALAHPAVERMDEAMSALDAGAGALGDADADGVRGDLALWRPGSTSSPAATATRPTKPLPRTRGTCGLASGRSCRRRSWCRARPLRSLGTTEPVSRC